MKPRHIARELALLTLFQVDKALDPASAHPSLSKVSIEKLMLASVQTLVDEAKAKLESAVQTFQATNQYILQMQQDDPANALSALDAPDVPVPLKTTQDTFEQLEQVLLAAEHMAEAFELPKLAVQFELNTEVRSFAIKLVTTVIEHKAALEQLIDPLCEDWKFERLAKMDRLILMLAAAEMRYFGKIDLSVSIDEAVELAHQFASEESYKFINGVLGGLATQLAAAPPDEAALLSNDSLDDVPSDAELETPTLSAP
jgi:N utilization substance protein B